MKKVKIYFLLILICFNCATYKNADNNLLETKKKSTLTDNEYYEAYKKSISSYYGYFEFEDLKLIHKNLQENSTRTIDFDKIIFIKYLQNGNFCYIEKNNAYVTVLNNIKSQNNKLTKLHDVESFLIFNPTFFQSYYLNEHKDWILDKGAFKEIIFTENRICSAFIAIKPNGNYYLYYGEDSFSKANEALMKKKWKKLKEIKAFHLQPNDYQYPNLQL